MSHWTLAFVGEGAWENYEVTRNASVFCVCASRTPVRRVQPGDGALLYPVGEGFVAEAAISSTAHAPYGTPDWSSKKPPSWSISVGQVRPFAKPVRYGFSEKGEHPVLGSPRHSLPGGFVEMSASDFEDVLGWARAAHETKTPEEPHREPPTATEMSSNPAHQAAVRRTLDRGLEKRTAGGSMLWWRGASGRRCGPWRRSGLRSLG